MQYLSSTKLCSDCQAIVYKVFNQFHEQNKQPLHNLPQSMANDCFCQQHLVELITNTYKKLEILCKYIQLIDAENYAEITTCLIELLAPLKQNLITQNQWIDDVQQKRSELNDTLQQRPDAGKEEYLEFCKLVNLLQPLQPVSFEDNPLWECLDIHPRTNKRVVFCSLSKQFKNQGLQLQQQQNELRRLLNQFHAQLLANILNMTDCNLSLKHIYKRCCVFRLENQQHIDTIQNFVDKQNRVFASRKQDPSPFREQCVQTINNTAIQVTRQIRTILITNMVQKRTCPKKAESTPVADDDNFDIKHPLTTAVLADQALSTTLETLSVHQHQPPEQKPNTDNDNTVDRLIEQKPSLPKETKQDLPTPTCKPIWRCVTLHTIFQVLLSAIRHLYKHIISFLTLPYIFVKQIVNTTPFSIIIF